MEYKKIRDLMTRHVTTISPETSVSDAAQVMRELDVGVLPVCSPDKILGMITDRDIVIRGVADGNIVDSHKVRDFMTPGVVFIFEDQDALEAVRVMELKKIRRLMVLNREKRLIGIVSLGDIALHEPDLELCGQAIRAISRRTENDGAMAGAKVS